MHENRIDVSRGTNPGDFNAGYDDQRMTAGGSTGFFKGAISVRVWDVREVRLRLQMFRNGHTVKAITQRFRDSDRWSHVVV